MRSQKLSWAAVKRTFKGWQLWIFTFSYAFWGWATNSNTWIILFLVSGQSRSSFLLEVKGGVS